METSWALACGWRSGVVTWVSSRPRCCRLAAPAGRAAHRGPAGGRARPRGGHADCGRRADGGRDGVRAGPPASRSSAGCASGPPRPALPPALPPAPPPAAGRGTPSRAAVAACPGAGAPQARPGPHCSVAGRRPAGTTGRRRSRPSARRYEPAQITPHV